MWTKNLLVWGLDNRWEYLSSWTSFFETDRIHTPSGLFVQAPQESFPIIQRADVKYTMCLVTEDRAVERYANRKDSKQPAHFCACLFESYLFAFNNKWILRNLPSRQQNTCKSVQMSKLISNFTVRMPRYSLFFWHDICRQTLIHDE